MEQSFKMLIPGFYFTEIVKRTSPFYIKHKVISGDLKGRVIFVQDRDTEELPKGIRSVEVTHRQFDDRLIIEARDCTGNTNV